MMNGARPLHLRLREDTQALHLRLHATDFGRALGEGIADRSTYIAYLQAMAIIHAPIERMIAVAPCSELTPTLQAVRPRLDWILKDLLALQPPFKEKAEVAGCALRVAAAAVGAGSGSQPTSLLGYIYVLEGSRRGAAHIKKQVACSLALPEGDGLQYLEQSAENSAIEWSKFQILLDAIALTEREIDALLAAARECFEGMIAFFEEIVSGRPMPLRAVATALNPEAGRHPVTQDEAEMTAVYRAGEITWGDLPYLAARYGERGRRFVTSDSAWFATLALKPKGLVWSQILWLNSVLAARGMPRLILASHLRTLATELGNSNGHLGGEYVLLEWAANELTAAGQEHIDAATATTIVEAFDRLARTTKHSHLRAGELIVAAVRDECCGVRRSLESLEPWLIARGAGETAWTDAIIQTVRTARAAATARNGKVALSSVGFTDTSAELIGAIDRSAIVSMTDAKGEITHVNDSFCEISGYTRDELIGQDHRILNSGAHSADFFREIWRTISAGRTWSGILQDKAKDGRIYYVQTVISPLRDQRGSIERYLAIRFDSM